jgi:hypothetical protein
MAMFCTMAARTRIAPIAKYATRWGAQMLVTRKNAPVLTQAVIA